MSLKLEHWSSEGSTDSARQCVEKTSAAKDAWRGRRGEDKRETEKTKADKILLE